MTTTNEHTGQILVSRTPDAGIKRIMIVDDSNDVNLTFKIVPGESDRRLRVHSFNDPLVALQEFKSELYDLVIIDSLMANGIKLYDKLRALDSKVKICFLTAESESYFEVIKEAFHEFGTNCSISKPVANENMIKHVKDMLELK